MGAFLLKQKHIDFYILDIKEYFMSNVGDSRTGTIDRVVRYKVRHRIGLISKRFKKKFVVLLLN